MRLIKTTQTNSYNFGIYIVNWGHPVASEWEVGIDFFKWSVGLELYK